MLSSKGSVTERGIQKQIWVGGPGKDLVGPHGGDEEASSTSLTCLPWGV